MHGLRKFVLFLLFIGVVVCALPYYCGYSVEKRLRSDIKSQLQQLDPLLHYELSYRRGWFASHAVLTVHADGDGLREWMGPLQSKLEEEQPGVFNYHVTVQFDLDVRHGPLLLTYNNQQVSGLSLARGIVYSRLVLPKPIQAKVDELTQNSPLLRTQLRYTLLGGSDHDLLGAGITFQSSKNEPRLEWPGWHAKIHVNPAADKQHFIFDMSDVRVSHKSKLMFDGLGIQGESRSHRAHGYDLWLGDAEFKIPHVTVYDNAANHKEIFELRDFYGQSQLQQNHKLLDHSLAVGFERLAAAGRTEIGPFHAKLSMLNLDAEAFAALEQGQRDLLSGGVFAAMGASMEYYLQLPALISHGFALELEQFSLKLPHNQHFDAKGALHIQSFDPDTTPLEHVPFLASIQLDISMPHSLLDFIAYTSARDSMKLDRRDDEAKVYVPSHAEIDAEARRRIQKLLQHKLITQDGDNYHFSMSLDSQHNSVSGVDNGLGLMLEILYPGRSPAWLNQHYEIAKNQ